MATFGRVSSNTPFFSIAVTLPASISDGKLKILRIWSEQFSAQTVFPFFSSFEDSRCPVIVTRSGSAATSSSFFRKSRDLGLYPEGFVCFRDVQGHRMQEFTFRLEPVVQLSPKDPAISIEDFISPAGQGIESFVHLIKQ